MEPKTLQSEAPPAQEYELEVPAEVPVQHPMPDAILRAYLMPLTQNALALKNGIEAILAHPHAVETLDDVGDPLKSISDKMWRMMIAALLKAS